MDVIQPKCAHSAGGCDVDRQLVRTVVQFYLLAKYAIVANSLSQVRRADTDVINKAFPVRVPSFLRGVYATVGAPSSDRISWARVHGLSRQPGKSESTTP
jgi:hypothetical protein